MIPNQKSDVNPVGAVRDEVRVGKLFDVLPEHQHLYPCQHTAEEVTHREPQVNADITDEPLAERGLETVPAGQGERNRSQYRKHDQEERPQRVDDKGGRVEHEFQQFAEEILNRLLHVIHCPVHIHPAGLYRVHHPQFVQFVVEGLLVDQIGRLGIALHRLELQPVLLRPVLVHVEGLCLQY